MTTLDVLRNNEAILCSEVSAVAANVETASHNALKLIEQRDSAIFLLEVEYSRKIEALNADIESLKRTNIELSEKARLLDAENYVTAAHFREAKDAFSSERELLKRTIFVLESQMKSLSSQLEDGRKDYSAILAHMNAVKPTETAGSSLIQSLESEIQSLKQALAARSGCMGDLESEEPRKDALPVNLTAPANCFSRQGSLRASASAQNLSSVSLGGTREVDFGETIVEESLVVNQPSKGQTSSRDSQPRELQSLKTENEVLRELVDKLKLDTKLLMEDLKIVRLDKNATVDRLQTEISTLSAQLSVIMAEQSTTEWLSSHSTQLTSDENSVWEQRLIETVAQYEKQLRALDELHDEASRDWLVQQQTLRNDLARAKDHVKTVESQKLDAEINVEVLKSNLTSEQALSASLKMYLETLGIEMKRRWSEQLRELEIMFEQSRTPETALESYEMKSPEEIDLDSNINSDTDIVKWLQLELPTNVFESKSNTLKDDFGVIRTQTECIQHCVTSVSALWRSLLASKYVVWRDKFQRVHLECASWKREIENLKAEKESFQDDKTVGQFTSPQSLSVDRGIYEAAIALLKEDLRVTRKELEETKAELIYDKPSVEMTRKGHLIQSVVFDDDSSHVSSEEDLLDSALNENTALIASLQQTLAETTQKLRTSMEAQLPDIAGENDSEGVVFNQLREDDHAEENLRVIDQTIRNIDLNREDFPRVQDGAHLMGSPSGTLSKEVSQEDEFDRENLPKTDWRQNSLRGFDDVITRNDMLSAINKLQEIITKLTENAGIPSEEELQGHNTQFVPVPPVESCGMQLEYLKRVSVYTSKLEEMISKKDRLLSELEGKIFVSISLDILVISRIPVIALLGERRTQITPIEIQLRGDIGHLSIRLREIVNQNESLSRDIRSMQNLMSRVMLPGATVFIDSGNNLTRHIGVLRTRPRIQRETIHISKQLAARVIELGLQVSNEQEFLNAAVTEIENLKMRLSRNEATVGLKGEVGPESANQALGAQLLVAGDGSNNCITSLDTDTIVTEDKLLCGWQSSDQILELWSPPSKLEDRGVEERRNSQLNTDQEMVAKLAALQIENDDLRIKLQAEAERVAGFREATVSSQSRANNLEHSMDLKNDEICHLQSSLAELKQEFARHIVIAEDAQEQLQRQLSIAEHACARLQREIDGFNPTVQTHSSGEDLRKSGECYLEEIAQLKSELEIQGVQNAKLKSELAHLRKDSEIFRRVSQATENSLRSRCHDYEHENANLAARVADLNHLLLAVTEVVRDGKVADDSTSTSPGLQLFEDIRILKDENDAYKKEMFKSEEKFAALEREVSRLNVTIQDKDRDTRDLSSQLSALHRNLGSYTISDPSSHRLSNAESKLNKYKRKVLALFEEERVLREHNLVLAKELIDARSAAEAAENRVSDLAFQKKYLTVVLKQLKRK
ncbi:hypothetical protein HDU93_000314 [Gonapodya sp. JEL0774]|nr:hypothetical protein HDU93_000314 [Gonapodya sp. JEL0774]